jgi:hypothetical protein
MFLCDLCVLSASSVLKSTSRFQRGFGGIDTAFRDTIERRRLGAAIVP